MKVRFKIKPLSDSTCIVLGIDQSKDECAKITDFEFPEVRTFKGTEYKVIAIQDHAFDACESLTNIAIPNSVEKIGKGAFSGCEALENVILPNNLKELSESVFSGCTSLQSITIPDSVTEIGEDTFSGCTSLQSITIPRNLTEVGLRAFTNTGLTNFTGANEHIVISDGILTKDGVLVTVVGSPVDLAIPDSVTEIGTSAFDGCVSLKSITIPDSVTEIGYGAFKGCTSLQSVTIPDNVTEIGSYAFLAAHR